MKPIMAGVAGLILLAMAVRADIGGAGVYAESTTLTWDESGSNPWDSLHWLGGPPAIPDAGTDAVLAATNPDTVTVSAAAEALSLTINGGLVFVATGGGLSVVDTTRLGSGGTLILDGGTMTTTSFQDTAGGTFHHHDGLLTVRGGTYAPGTTNLTVNGNTPTALPHLVLDGATSGGFGSLLVGGDAHGALTVTGGSEVTTSGGAYVGRDTGSAGAVTVSGTGSTWTTDQYLVVGNAGAGTLAVTGGSQVATGGWGYVGYHVGSTSQATVDGGGSAWTITGNLYLGGSESGAGGTATLAVTGGGAVSVGGTLKLWPTGTATLDGGLISTQTFDRTAGTFNWDAGTLRFTNDLLVDAGQPFGSSVTVAAGRNLDVAGILQVDNGEVAVTGGGQISSGSGYVGLETGSTGEVTVDGSGSTWTTNQHLVVGNFGSGTLAVTGGGQVATGNWAVVGYWAGATGEVAVDGSGSTWTITSDLNVGHSGAGTLAVTGGGRVSSSRGFVGYSAGSMGEATVDGSGSMWTTSDLYVGTMGAGTLAVTGGGRVSSSRGFVGTYAGWTCEATVDGSGSAWTITGDLYLGGWWEPGAGGTGTLTVQNEGLVSVGGTLKLWPAGTATLDGGTIATQTFDRTVGTFNWNAGTLRFTDDLLVDTGQPFGSTVTVPSGRNLEVADALTVGSGGTVSLEGGTLTTTSLLNTVGGGVGHYDGTLTVRGGTYAPGTANLRINGNTPTALPHLVLDGATPANAFANVLVGDNAQGALTVAGGSQISIAWAFVAYGFGSTGEVTVDGSGSTFTTTSDLFVGESGHGTLTITGGGQVFSGFGFVGDGWGATGEVTVDGSGSTWTTAYDLMVGCLGHGTLTITGGGQVVTGGEGDIVSWEGGTTGDVTVDGGGSTWTITDDLLVGFSGAGTLTVTGGGQVATGGRGFVGYWDGGTGEVTVDGSGSMWSTSGKLVVGATGAAGTLTVTGGGQVATGGSGYVGRNTDSTGEVTVDGTDSGWSITGSLYVGGSDSAAGGPGTLTVRNGGQLAVGETLRLWRPDSAVTVNGGTLSCGALAGLYGNVRITDPAGGTALTVGSAASDTFAGALVDDTGPGSLTKIGAGTQTLVGTGITYTGTTRVLDGTLELADTTAFASPITNDAAVEFSVANGLWTFSNPLGGTGLFMKSGPCMLAVAGPQDYGPGAAFDVLDGILALETDATGTGLMADARLALSATGGELRLAAAQHLDTLTVGTGGQVVFAGADRAVMRHLANTGVIDLATAALVVDYEAGASPLADVAAWVRSGLNAGAGYWNGPGIASSAAAGDPDGLTAVGLLDNTDPKVGGKTTFESEPVDATAVLVKYTWWGDANLDGIVDANDYDVIDKMYLFPPAADNMGWWTGDFTYDGLIDANDYDRIDKAYLFQTGPLAAGDRASPAATPEPATLALVALGGLGLLGVRRHRGLVGGS